MGIKETKRGIQTELYAREEERLKGCDNERYKGKRGRRGRKR
jgi:hypothetical protein